MARLRSWDGHVAVGAGRRLAVRAASVADTLRGSLWLVPSLAVAAALTAGLVLPRIEAEPAGAVSAVLFTGGPEGARAVLQVIAGSMITVTSLTFSLTVVALQLAATTYSPRLLRGFLRDRSVQVVLATFLATFTYSYTVLRQLRADADGVDRFVPEIAVTAALPLVLASLAALVYFLHHITQSIRVETVVRAVAHEAMRTVGSALPELPLPEGLRRTASLPVVPPGARAIRSTRSGFVQRVEPEGLVAMGAHAGLVVQLRRAVGGHVTSGTVLAWVWDGGSGGPPEEVEAVDETVRRAVQLGDERTTQADVALSVQQLTDIALRALSTGVNDPSTAVEALHHVAPVLAALAARPLGHSLHLDDEGTVRAVVPGHSLDDYLWQVVAAVRRAAPDEPVVLVHLLELLADVAASAQGPGDRLALEAQVTAVLAQARESVALASDLARVEQAAAEALAALGRPAGGHGAAAHDGGTGASPGD